MDLSVGQNQCDPSIIIKENVTGSTTDTNGHSGGLNLERLITLELLGHFKINCTLGQFQFQLFVLLDEFGTAVRLECHDFSIIQADRCQSVRSRTQGITALETYIINNGFLSSACVFYIDCAFYTQKTHRCRPQITLKEKDIEDNDSRDHQYKCARNNDFRLCRQTFDLIY